MNFEFKKVIKNKPNKTLNVHVVYIELLITIANWPTPNATSNTLRT